MIDSIKDRLCQILSEVKGYKITQNSIENDLILYKQLDIDSLSALQIIVLIEKEFNVHIDDDQTAIEILGSLNEASEYIEAALQETDQEQNEFIIRSGSQLLLHGKVFRFAGANMYWLGLDENVDGINYPTRFRVDDAFSTAEDMGARVVRAHTLGISVGCSLCFEPSLSKFNETAFEYADYAIQSARNHHMRLIIPLTDNWRYYHGGKHTFTEWNGIDDENAFYTNQVVIHDFEAYINMLLNHVNRYTGVAYKDDPTIMAWETGNELTPPTSWTKIIADYIKSIDNYHLVIDGSFSVNKDALPLKNVDIYTVHYYPMNISNVQKDSNTVNAANKVFYIGEYGWQDSDQLKDFLTAIENSGAAGDTYWSFFPHHDLTGYVQHNDGYTLHYPGDNDAMCEAVQVLRAHAYEMQNQVAPPVSSPGSPVITSIQGKAITWRGTATGASYAIERSVDGLDGPWIVVCKSCTDNQSPWIDRTQPPGILWYRIQAYNIANVGGPYSAVYQTIQDL